MKTKPNLACTFLLVAVLQLTAPVSQSHSQDDETPLTVRFIDSDGETVSGVKAYWYRDGKSKRVSQTDGVGKIATGKGLIVATKAGFQFSGVVLDNNAKTSATVVLLRNDEPGPAHKTRPVPITDEQKNELIQEIEEDYWTQLKLKPKDPQNLSHCINILCRLSPEKALEYFEENPAPAQFKMMAKNEIALGLAKTDFEAAVEIVDSVEDPMYRSFILGSLVKEAPSNTKALASVETAWIDSLKDIPQPAYRIAGWANLAAHYRNTGRPELAQKIIDQNIEEVKKLPAGGWSGLPRSLFAALVVETDPDLGARLIEGMNKNEVDRALGRLAFHCCRTDPKKAMEFLSRLGPSRNSRAVIATNQIKVCHRMALEQTDSAFELAASIEEPNQRAWAFALMAQRLNETKPEQAAQALATAIETMAKTNQTEHGAWFSPASTTAAFLPIAEQVSPNKTNAIIWQSVYLAIPRSRWNTGFGSKLENIQTAAASISRYDEPLAKALLGANKIKLGSEVSRSATNQVALDVASLPEFLKQLENHKHSGAFTPRKIVAKLLTGSDEEFWQAVSKPKFLDWPKDEFEDF